MAKLTGRVAVVTGAGRGIGCALSQKLGGEGALLVLNDLDEAVNAEVVDAIVGQGGRAVAFPGDVTAPDFADRLIAAALDAYGGLHIVVNNAGYIWNTAFHNHTDEQWQAMLDVHATAPFRILRAAGNHFREAARQEREAGTPVCRKVVNVVSISGLAGTATQAAYASAKMAAVGLTKSLAREWGRLNVTVNAVAFGPMETRLAQDFEDDPATIEIQGREHKVGIAGELRETVRQRIPLGRFGTAEEAAGAIYLFCIPESDYITGEVVLCAGGLTYL
ncbi:MAG: SDR family oxidoreductase [Alphaproteobacteria bacterium]|jgi:3-oxoacyl-[acyl-carrier protein] reductase|nr:SDR family oxidoreductase [Alphaproteobacteria bacterium]